jgi:hypothetical protein
MLSSSSYNFLRASLSSSSYFANALINIVVVVLVTFDFLLLTLYVINGISKGDSDDLR